MFFLRPEDKNNSHLKNESLIAFDELIKERRPFARPFIFITKRITMPT
jgi:hypothetical protein